MEKKINPKETVVDTSPTLEKLLYNDPEATFRVRVENAKRQLEKSKYESIVRQNLTTPNKISVYSRK